MNLGLLGEKQICYLCAMQPLPPPNNMNLPFHCLSFVYNFFLQSAHLFHISLTDWVARFFPAPAAGAGIRTHVSRLASPLEALKDALPIEQQQPLLLSLKLSFLVLAANDKTRPGPNSIYKLVLTSLFKVTCSSCLSVMVLCI